MVVEHTTGTWLVLLDRDSASDSLRDLRAVGAAVLASAASSEGMERSIGGTGRGARWCGSLRDGVARSSSGKKANFACGACAGCVAGEYFALRCLVRMGQVLARRSLM